MTEPVTITITASGPQGCGKTTVLDALVQVLHDAKVVGRPSQVMPRSHAFRLIKSFEDSHTVQLKGFRL
jgi:Mg-chelatase subunit ChlI